MKTISISVRGKVQGVFFRANTEKIARELKLLGWVKNEDDGSVRIVARGDEASLKKLIDWCHKGPEAARVDSVEITEVDTDVPLGDFCIYRSC